MKLNLDFSLYKGTTRLKQWWKEVLSHFKQVQEAHNALDTALSDEVTARTSGDSNLQTQLNTHTASRGSSAVYGHVKLSDSVTTSSSTATAATPAAVKTAYDKAVQGVNDAAGVQTNLDTEVGNRQSAESALDKKISDEAKARGNADNALDGRVTAVEGKAHTHANKTVLDGITETDIANWNGILEQVTQTQLEAVKAYFEELCYGFEKEFANVWGAIGITVYDCGMFGQEQTNTIDCGTFEDEATNIIDCGGFEPITVGVGTNVDGGTY